MCDYWLLGPGPTTVLGCAESLKGSQDGGRIELTKNQLHVSPFLASSISMYSSFKHEFVMRITYGHCREKQKIYARTTETVRTAAVKE
jgi:hypothetical protein